MTKQFIVREKFKDGSLTERMTQEGIPVELIPRVGNDKYIVYEASAELVRSLVNAGAPLVLLPETNLDEWKYIYSVDLKPMHENMLINTPLTQEGRPE